MPGWSMIDDVDESWHSYEIDSQENPLLALLEAVSEVTNDAPDDMEILYDVVEPGAIRDFFEHPAASKRGLRLSFRYNGCQIVMSRRYVHVRGEDES